MEMAVTSPDSVVAAEAMIAGQYWCGSGVDGETEART